MNKAWVLIPVVLLLTLSVSFVAFGRAGELERPRELTNEPARLGTPPGAEDDESGDESDDEGVDTGPILEVVSLDSPPVTADGGCTISEWTATLRNLGDPSSPFDDVFVENVSIIYEWSVPGLQTPSRTIPIGTTVPAGGTSSVQFLPITAGDLVPEMARATALLALTFDGETFSGVPVSVTATAELFVEACFGPAFIPDEPTPGSNTVAMAEGAVLGNTISVLVNVTDTSDVYAAAFHLVYDPAHVGFVSWSPGTLLETGGVSPVYVVASPQPGRLVVGASRLGPVPGVDVTGTQTLIAMSFVVLQPGASPAWFENERLIGPKANSLPDIQWFGGLFAAN